MRIEPTRRRREGLLHRCARAVPPLAVAVALLGAPAAQAAPRAYVDHAGRCHSKLPCYPSIQIAVDRSAAGTAILVYPGTYREHVTVSKALTLRGRGATIDGGGGGTLLSLSGHGIAVRTLRLKNGAIGVGLHRAGGDRLSGLHVARVQTGIFFSAQSRGNLVRDTEVSRARRFAIDVGDQDDSGNRFLRLRLHDSATGFNAYRGSDGLLLRDSSIRGIGPGPAVVVGWSDGWQVVDNEIVHNATGILTDTVHSGSIARNYIVRNTGNGIDEVGLVSTVVTRENRIAQSGLSGIALCIAARDNQVWRNLVFDNARYGVEICAHPSSAYVNSGNVAAGNYLFGQTAGLGDALDDQGSNTWSGNYYGRNQPWSAPFAIPGAAGAWDAGPLTLGDLPKPTTAAECGKRGWWLLTDGQTPFGSEKACTRFVASTPEGDMDCADFPTQRAAQIFYLNHGGPEYDPHHLDGDRDGIACEDNPCPCYFGNQLPASGRSSTVAARRRANYPASDGVLNALIRSASGP